MIRLGFQIEAMLKGRSHARFSSRGIRVSSPYPQARCTVDRTLEERHLAPASFFRFTCTNQLSSSIFGKS